MQELHQSAARAADSGGRHDQNEGPSVRAGGGGKVMAAAAVKAADASSCYSGGSSTCLSHRIASQSDKMEAATLRGCETCDV